MILEHIEKHWTSHLAAGSGTVFSLLNGSAMLQSIIVGVCIYIITHLLHAVFNKLRGK